jgi:hypothetical protein
VATVTQPEIHMKKSPNAVQSFLRASLRQFFRAKGKALPPTEYCPDCGSLLVNIVSQFWLEGDDESWNIPLPYCLHCLPELATRIPTAA